MLVKKLLLKMPSQGNPWNDGYTRLYLPFENDAEDHSIGHTETHTPTTSGISFSSATKKVGSYSVYLNGSAYVTYPDSTDFDFGYGDFTIHGWLYTTSSGARQGILSTAYGVGVAGGWAFYIDTDDYLKFYYNINVSGNVLSVDFSSKFNKWTHFALVRVGTGLNDFSLYLDGVNAVSGTGNYGVNTIAYPLQIGQVYYSGNPGYFRLVGYLDAIYIDKGIARWTSDFTPPA